MEPIKDIKDFKHFLEINRDKLYAIAENADDISLNDEWMQENQWDEIYKQGEKKDGSAGCFRIIKLKIRIIKKVWTDMQVSCLK